MKHANICPVFIFFLFFYISRHGENNAFNLDQQLKPWAEIKTAAHKKKKRLKLLINKFYTPTCTFCRVSCFNIFRWNYLRIFNNALLVSLDFSLFNKWLKSIKFWACCVFYFVSIVSFLWLHGLSPFISISILKV